MADKGIAVFKGASEVPLYSSDVCYPEYQEAYFYYLFGATEMDCVGVIDFATEKPILFAPKLDRIYEIWMTLHSAEDLSKKYGFEVREISELASYLNNERKPDTIYINKGVNSDSKLTTCHPDLSQLGLSGEIDINSTRMHDILAESRVIKNEEEIDAMRWASQITAEAHVYSMQNIKPGMRECQLESFFSYYGQQQYFTGRVAPYISICGCGPNAATLHYVDNDKTLVDGQIMLADQGHSLHHYTSDVTVSFPVNGKFTQKQANIYNLVHKCKMAV